MTQQPPYLLESAKQGILLEVPATVQSKEPPSVVLASLDEALEDARSMASRGENAVAATASSDMPKRNRKISHFNIADIEGKNH